MTGLDLQTLAQIFTERLVNTAAEGIVFAGLIWVLLRLTGRQNSGSRFAIWFSALLAIVALPLFAGSAPVASSSRAFTLARLHGEIILSSSWAIYLFAAWGVVASLLLLRLGAGIWRVRQICRNLSEVNLASLDPAIAGILRHSGSRRQVKLCVSNELAVPAAIGFFRPAIVFPAWLLPQLSPEEIKLILLHELAHLHRRDDWTNLAQKIVRSVFFFHPAVWWIENRLTLEREMACDDVVLAQTASPRAYASSLISFAEKLQNARSLALAQALVSRMRHMSLRLTQILDAKRPSRTGLWKPAFGLGACMLALAVGTAPYAPQFVAFQTQPKQGQVQQEQATNNNSQSRVAGKVTSRTNPALEAKVSSRMLLPRAIPAVFTMHATAFPVRLKVSSRREPLAILARAAQREVPSHQTFVILETTQYGASGSGVWTLCIWRVRGGNLAERQLESAIIMSSI